VTRNGSRLLAHIRLRLPDVLQEVLTTFKQRKWRPVTLIYSLW